jgi:hypothetical protein
MAGNTTEQKTKPQDERQRRQRGQSMVEFALLLPIFLVVLFLIIDFGVGVSRWVVITNSTREGARIGAVGATTAEIADKVSTTSNGLLAPSDVNVYYLDTDGNGDVGDRGDSVVVESSYDYGLITPLQVFLGLAFDSITLNTCTDMRLELAVSAATGGGSGC